MFEIIREKCKEQKVLIAVLFGVSGLFVVTCLIVVLVRPKAQTTFSSLSSQSTSFLASSSNTETSHSSSKATSSVIVVDVKGAVQKEGVYTLKEGSRVSDAIAKAGDLNQEADKKSINLAQKLTDEAIVYVAKSDENISVVNQDSTSTRTVETTKSNATDKINLNTASLEELKKISGIGDKRAQDILDYRDAQGGFKSIDELTNVSGIGSKTLEKLKNDVTVD
ncbi:helix-hairpin-helix domain-containing protein [Streptococcus sciuri]|uniref:Helix-hairpin-helix domain-containing protein n=1 Tax=Streptococcus sciuri TaxID=2973939 RepID=A0ABT2F8Y8_9STRE|nr:helix-hairpin-helix domain-containing protein [Streptococcus sciuri]MCS4488295.1 helix-hairpin-helix domain-containing protein [Streptococcus sciuri]